MFSYTLSCITWVSTSLWIPRISVALYVQCRDLRYWRRRRRRRRRSVALRSLLIQPISLNLSWLNNKWSDEEVRVIHVWQYIALHYSFDWLSSPHYWMHNLSFYMPRHRLSRIKLTNILKIRSNVFSLKCFLPLLYFDLIPFVFFQLFENGPLQIFSKIISIGVWVTFKRGGFKIFS